MYSLLLPLVSLSPLTLETALEQWQQQKLSNFEYLMLLNAEAGRSLSDLAQYPIFPHILCDFTSSTLNLKDPSIYRDLSEYLSTHSNHPPHSSTDLTIVLVGLIGDVKVDQSAL